MAYQKNELVTVKIEDIGNDGEGIGKVEGYTLFVKDAVIGDEVQARITRPKKNYAYARCEKILTPSPYRSEPVCAFHRQCGGCQIQALSYEKQLAFKQGKVRNNLIRLGGFTPEEVDKVMEPVVGMEEPYHYRNKALFPVGTDRQGNLITGFYAGRTHDIIANTDCALGVTENKEILETVLDYMRTCKVSAYEETTGKGLVRHILIRKGFTSGQLMVCLIINTPAQDREKNQWLPGQQELIDRLTGIPGMTSISVNINREKTNVVLGKETHTIWGSDTIEDTIHMRETVGFSLAHEKDAVTYHISPQSFYQVNPVQTEKLYSLALEYAGLTGKETVWDLYCGIGTISLFLARRAKQVYGVEIVPQAIQDARRNATDNGITNAEFFVGKAEDILTDFYHKEDKGNEEMRHPDVIVVDPPRKGCDALCLNTMLRMAPERIVYVSCDSATLARDLRILCDGGYELQKVRPVDQFGQTGHVETVALLSKLDVDKHIDVEIKLDELDLTSAESKATYAQIKEYIMEKFDLKVSTLYIAQIKKKCGIVLREHYNKSKKEKQVIPQCTPEKEEAIMDALKHFKMI